MKDEEFIRSVYRSYIEIWARNEVNNKVNRDVLYGGILAYGRVLEFTAIKIERDLQMAKNKYISI